MLRTIELIGATVVATFSLPLSSSNESLQPSEDVGAVGVTSCAWTVRSGRAVAIPAPAAMRESDATREERRRSRRFWDREYIHTSTPSGTEFVHPMYAYSYNSQMRLVATATIRCYVRMVVNAMRCDTKGVIDATQFFD